MTEIVIDFDNTIANSSVTALRHAPILRSTSYKGSLIKDLSLDHFQRNLEWNFKPYTDDPKQVVDFMSSDAFWKYLQPMPGCVEFLEKHYNVDKLYLCSCRAHNNYTPLLDWLDEKKLSQYFTDIVLLTTNSFDKSIVSGKDRIIIDDQPRCLQGEWKRKILFGDWKYQITGIKNTPGPINLEWATDGWKSPIFGELC